MGRTGGNRVAPEAAATSPARAGAAAPPTGAVMGRAAKEQIRGSSLLLSGRGIALGTKFVTQLAMVRYLSTADYGAWAYALAAVTLLGGFSSLSLDRGATRFAAIYHERGDYDRFFGTLLLVAGMILVTGTIFAGALHLFPDQLGRLMGREGSPLLLLLVLVFLVPLEGLDQLLIATFATLGRAGAIFFRKYLLGPLLQLGAVLLLVGLREDIVFLARAYLTATLIGVAVNTVLLVRLLEEEGLLRRFRLRSVRLPVRELFAFSLPLLSTDLLAVLIESFGILLLGYLADTREVALLRAIVPLALLCQVVDRSFRVLYLPTASRLYAAHDRDGIRDLYWRTSLWVAVLSFPAFAVVFTAASPLAVLLYGPRYEASGPLLAVLAFGVYVKTSLGISGSTLKVLGRVRTLVATNLASAVACVALSIALIPVFGAQGAAAAMAATMVLDGVLKQTNVRRAAGLNLLSRENVRPWAVIGTVMLALTLVRTLAPANLVLLGAAALAGVVTVLAATRRMLGIELVFPELNRFPLLRWIVR